MCARKRECYPRFCIGRYWPELVFEANGHNSSGHRAETIFPRTRCFDPWSLQSHHHFYNNNNSRSYNHFCYNNDSCHYDIHGEQHFEAINHGSLVAHKL